MWPTITGAVFTMALAVGGFTITSYMSLRADIAIINSRVAVLESQRTRDDAFLAETRAALDKISAQIADLRVLIAAKGNK